MSQLHTYIVIGSGSIARRHIANLKLLFPKASVGCVSASGRELSLDETGADSVYSDFPSAMEAKPVFVVVASPAPFHVDHATYWVSAGIPVLVEKPLSSSYELFRKTGAVLRTNSHKIGVAYNLRHLNSAKRLQTLLAEKIIGRVHTVLVDVGQYLPDWRPATDYRKNVSAQRALGGGVLLELSHELDYLTWLFGEFDTAYCVATNSGVLEIDVEDRVDAILVRKDGLVANLHMDFLQRKTTRVCKIVGEEGTLLWDLTQNNITLRTGFEGDNILFSDPDYDRNCMYLDELDHFSKVAAGIAEPLVSIEHALYVLRLVDALKYSSTTRLTVNIGEFES